MVKYFTGAIIARLPKTGIFGSWSLAGYNGIWRADNSGGGLEFRSSFLQNPQVLRIHLMRILSSVESETFEFIKKHVED